MNTYRSSLQTSKENEREQLDRIYTALPSQRANQRERAFSAIQKRTQDQYNNGGLREDFRNDWRDGLKLHLEDFSPANERSTNKQ